MKAVLGVAVAAAAVLGATGVAAERQDIELQRDCEITVGMEAIPVQAEPVTVPIRHSEALGDSITATFPADAKVGVVSVGREDGDEENTLRLVLNTGEAAPGEWALTVKGTAAECRGTAKIAAAETDGR